VSNARNPSNPAKLSSRLERVDRVSSQARPGEPWALGEKENGALADQSDPPATPSRSLSSAATHFGMSTSSML